MSSVPLPAIIALSHRPRSSMLVYMRLRQLWRNFLQAFYLVFLVAVLLRPRGRGSHTKVLHPG